MTVSLAGTPVAWEKIQNLVERISSHPGTASSSHGQPSNDKTVLERVPEIAKCYSL